jgi:hypothetical protein
MGGRHSRGSHAGVRRSKQPLSAEADRIFALRSAGIRTADRLYKLAHRYIISESGNPDELPDIVELPLEVMGFDYLLKDSFGQSAIRNISYQYFGHKFRMILDLTTDYTEEQISQILTFSAFYGSVSARIVCSPGSTHELCNRRLESLPTYNQFKIQTDPVEQQRYEDFTSMYEYRYQIATRIHAVDLSPAEFDRLFKDDMLDGGRCKSTLSSLRLGICTAVQRLSPVSLSIYEAMKTLGEDLYKMEVGEEQLNKIAPILNVSESHKGEVVTFEMRDHKFSWPGTSWSQIDPVEFPTFWSIDWADLTTPPTAVVFAEDFFFSKFSQGYYISDRISEYGRGTGGFSGWTNGAGEAFRIRGIARGGLVSGKISIHFQLKDGRNLPRTFLEIMQRSPGTRLWTSARVHFAPTATTHDELGGASVIYSIENIFIPEGWEVLLRFVVPVDIQWDERGQFFTLYLAELRGVRCPIEIFQEFKQFCK